MFNESVDQSANDQFAKAIEVIGFDGCKERCPVRCFAFAHASTRACVLQELRRQELTILSDKRAAAIMSLIQLARMNGHDPYVYLKDVLTRLPTQKARETGQLLLHQWMPS